MFTDCYCLKVRRLPEMERGTSPLSLTVAMYVFVTSGSGSNENRNTEFSDSKTRRDRREISELEILIPFFQFSIVPSWCRYSPACKRVLAAIFVDSLICEEIQELVAFLISNSSSSNHSQYSALTAAPFVRTIYTVNNRVRSTLPSKRWAGT